MKDKERKNLMKTEIEFLKQTSERFNEAFDRILKAVDQLEDPQVWARLSSESNSVGIILQHLIGNLSQWVCAGIGGAGYQRNRPAEFRDEQHPFKDEILQQFINLKVEVERVISRVQPDSLLEPRRIQDLDVNVMSAFYKAITHFEFHEGQILCIAKIILNTKYVGIWGPRKTS
jgi:hypothetical protein